MRLSAQGAEYVHVPVTVDGAAPDPGMPVALAFLATGVPTAGTTWAPAEWSAGQARLLVGTGGHVLAPGMYEVWVRVVAAPEVVVRSAGTLTIY